MKITLIFAFIFLSFFYGYCASEELSLKDQIQIESQFTDIAQLRCRGKSITKEGYDFYTDANGNVEIGLKNITELKSPAKLEGQIRFSKADWSEIRPVPQEDQLDSDRLVVECVDKAVDKLWHRWRENKKTSRLEIQRLNGFAWISEDLDAFKNFGTLEDTERCGYGVKTCLVPTMGESKEQKANNIYSIKSWPACIIYDDLNLLLREITPYNKANFPDYTRNLASKKFDEISSTSNLYSTQYNNMLDSEDDFHKIGGAPVLSSFLPDLKKKVDSYIRYSEIGNSNSPLDIPSLKARIIAVLTAFPDGFGLLCEANSIN